MCKNNNNEVWDRSNSSIQFGQICLVQGRRSSCSQLADLESTLSPSSRDDCTIRRHMYMYSRSHVHPSAPCIDIVRV